MPSGNSPGPDRALIRSRRGLGLVFFGSGFAALIYQVVWQRLLTLPYGVGTISIAVIVSAYMLGLGLGALLGGVLAERIKNKILLYFGVELLIGMFGVASLPFFKLLARATAGSGYAAAFFYQFIFLLFPTLLMGISLPLLIKIFQHLLSSFIRSVSWLYFINTLGAAAGSAFAAYVLISFGGLDLAVYFAAALNLVLAGAIFLLGRSRAQGPWSEAGIQDQARDEPGLRGASALALLTGFLAIGYEMIWFRIIGVLIKDSPYAFATVLAVYLLGLALGSLAVNRYVSSWTLPERKSIFFCIQFFIGVSVLLTGIGYYYLTKFTPAGALSALSFAEQLHPRAGLDWSHPSAAQVFTQFDVLVWPLFWELLPTFFMGAGFPLITDLALTRPEEEGRTAGRIYFFNTIGNLLGGLVTGLILLRFVGSEITLLVLAAVNILMILGASQVKGITFPKKARIAVAGVFLAIGAIFFPRPGQLYEIMHTSPGPGFTAYFQEGISGVVMTYCRGEEVLNYINGQGHGNRPGTSFIVETMAAMSFAPKAEKVLVIGYGTGSVAETALLDPRTKKVIVVELSRDLMVNLKKIEVFQRLLSDPRLSLIYDDGRRFLLRNRRKYDLILMDPLRVTTAYSNNLYSREFFEIVKDRLEPDGVLMVWMDEGKVISRTLAEVFPEVRMFGWEEGQYFCLARQSPGTPEPDVMRKILAGFAEPAQESILFELEGINFLRDREGIRRDTDGGPINRDLRPVSEYYLGLRRGKSPRASEQKLNNSD